MERGSTSETLGQAGKQKGGQRLGSMLPQIEPFIPKKDHNPRELRSWAKRTGFVSTFSGETTASVADGAGTEKDDSAEIDLERGRDQRGGSSPKIEIDPILGRTRPNRGFEIEPASGSGAGVGQRTPRDESDGALGLRNGPARGESKKRRIGVEPVLEPADDEGKINLNGNGNENGNGVVNRNGQQVPAVTPAAEPKKEESKSEEEIGIDVNPDDGEPSPGGWRRSSQMKCGLRETPGFVPLIYYGLQHYLSLAGSIIFIPLVIVPAMGGTDNDTATVISTMLLLTGITTILQSYFGTRLPLVQGSSFVYLAPALVIINSREYRNLSEHKFRHIMRELQGAIIVSSIFQSILGFSGLMSLILRFINPVVVAPTVAGVGLAFFSYGFPEAGSCVEISIPQILLVLIFTLYLRGLSISGHRIFRIYARYYAGIFVIVHCFSDGVLKNKLTFPTYFLFVAGIYLFLALNGTCVSSSLDYFSSLIMFFSQFPGQVPLSILIIWSYAFFLTAGGAYNYKGCSPDIPSSNIILDACRRHAYTMKHCRTDVSNAWRTAAWVRIPYPLQWGVPIFHLRTSIIMVIVSLVASVDSVGTYHSTSLLINSKPPTPGIVSRGIGLEGFCSILAGLWGSGTGSTTLTENVHTINTTKMACRRALQLGAAFLIFLSFIGKVGAILASIPQALAASVLCFMWALTVALGLSTLQYTQSASFRNITIVGVSLFLGLSIPAYFQQYQLDTSLILPSYFIPYAAASSGPIHTGSEPLDFALNALLSMNMVVTLLVAFVLDNTVPGSRQERGVYIWSRAQEMETDPSFLADYSLPKKIAPAFCRTKCLGC